MDLFDKIKEVYNNKEPKIEILEIREHVGYKPGVAFDYYLSNGRIITTLSQTKVYHKKEYVKPTLTKNDSLANINF